MPMPSGAATARTWSRCSCTSQQVSCRVLTGRPESSNWPPGSRVTLASPLRSAIGRLCSLTRLPAELARQALEQRADAPLALVRQRPQVVLGVAELLVLGADPPRRLRLAAVLQELDQLAAIGDRCALFLRWRGHLRLPYPARRQRESPPGPGRASPYRGAASACQARRLGPPRGARAASRRRDGGPDAMATKAGDARPPAPGVPSSGVDQAAAWRAA